MLPFSRKPLVKVLPCSITLTGETAVGTSTTMEYLAPLYDACEQVSGGILMRRYAKKEGYDESAPGKMIEDFVRVIPDHPEWDYNNLVDRELRQKALEDRKLIESRLIHLWSPFSFHVLVTCPYPIRAYRRQKHKKYQDKTVEEVEQLIRERDRNNWLNFEALYPGCHWSKEDYDLEVYTGKYSPEQIRDQIVEAHKIWVQKHKDKIVQ